MNAIDSMKASDSMNIIDTMDPSNVRETSNTLTPMIMTEYVKLMNDDDRNIAISDGGLLVRFFYISFWTENSMRAILASMMMLSYGF